jgi:hypothetical protein
MYELRAVCQDCHNRSENSPDRRRNTIFSSPMSPGFIGRLVAPNGDNLALAKREISVLKTANASVFSPSGSLNKSPESRSAWYIILYLIYIGLCLLIGVGWQKTTFRILGFFLCSDYTDSDHRMPLVCRCRKDTGSPSAELMSVLLLPPRGGGFEDPPRSDRPSPEVWGGGSKAV